MSRPHSYAILIFTVILLIGSLLYGRIIVDGDGLTYYALARSLAQDADFDLRNQREQIPNLHLIISPVTRRIATRFSCGFGILYAPFLYLSEKIGALHSGFAEWTPYRQSQWLPYPHALAIFIGSLVFGLLTLFFSYLLLKQSTNVSTWYAIFLPLAMFFGSSLLFYVFTMPSYVHAADAFLMTVAFYLAVASPEWQYKKVRWRNILLGATLGLSVLLRNNNIVVIPSFLFALWLRTEPKNRDSLAGRALSRFVARARIMTLIEILIGAIPFVLILGAFNLNQYGKLIATGYEVQTREWYLLKMLFHPYASIFLWTPITVLGLAGLIAGSVKRRLESITALSCVLLVLLSVQFQPNWWGGCSFGPRFFTHLFVFWVWGLLEMVRLIRRPAITLILCCAVWTFFLYNVSFINSVSPEFRKVLRTNYCRRTPLEMIRSATSDYRQTRQDGETSGPFHFWLHSTGKGNYPTVLWILMR